MSLGSRAAFLAWRLYRTSAVARVALAPVVKRSAEQGLAAHDAFVDEARPSAAWAAPRSAPGAQLRVFAPPSGLARERLLGLLNHWRARYELCPLSLRPELATRDPEAVVLEPASPPEQVPRVAWSAVALLGRDEAERGLEELRATGHAAFARAYGECPLPNLRGTPGGARSLLLDPRTLAPRFAASAWGSVLPDAIDHLIGARDWRAPLPPLVSARVDDVTGASGLGWLFPLEEVGIRPSIGTLHDAWLRAGDEPRRTLVAASRRGASVCPHAFDMDRFIWYDAPAGRPFAAERLRAHREKIERDVRETGLLLGKTVNAHFDVLGANAIEELRALGFRYVVGEHLPDQDWREGPRRRDPLGTPLYAYGPWGGLFGFQAEGAIASSAAHRSLYDWLRNSIATDRRGRPIPESLDRAGAVRQGVTQLLAALHAGFPGYLLAHEVHLDALGPERVGDLLEEVLREVSARVPAWRPAAFDELPAACESYR